MRYHEMTAERVRVGLLTFMIPLVYSTCIYASLGTLMLSRAGVVQILGIVTVRTERRL